MPNNYLKALGMVLFKHNTMQSVVNDKILTLVIITKVNLFEKFPYGSGVISYSNMLIKNLVSLSNNVTNSLRIIVLSVGNRARSINNILPNVYIISVRGFIEAILVLPKILRKSHNRIVHIQHEFRLYGNPYISTLLILLLGFLLIILRTPLIITLHGVIPRSLLNNKNFLHSESRLKLSTLYKVALCLFYNLIVHMANYIIVHDNVLSKLLREWLKDKLHHKIKVIPHGTDCDAVPISKDIAKRALGLKVADDTKIILYLGYISPYKAVDDLIEAFGSIYRKLCGKVCLLIGGSLNPYRVKDKRYVCWFKESFLKKMYTLKIKLDRESVIWLGFVPSDKLPYVISASDLVVLPYRWKISASGPEHIALSYEKPIIIYVSSYSDVDRLRNLILWALERLDKLRIISRRLKYKRCWINVAKEHIKLYLISSRKRISTDKFTEHNYET